MSAIKKLPLALSSINNTLGTALENHDHGHNTNGQAEVEVQHGKKRPFSEQGLQDSASKFSKQNQRQNEPNAQSGSQNVPRSRKLLASPRTAQMVASKAQEVAKRLPRSWENPSPPGAPQHKKLHKLHERISRSEACSPRASNTAEFWNEGLTPRQLEIRSKVSC